VLEKGSQLLMRLLATSLAHTPLPLQARAQLDASSSIVDSMQYSLHPPRSKGLRLRPFSKEVSTLCEFGHETTLLLLFNLAPNTTSTNLHTKYTHSV
jgi:hypothetical protein